MHIDDRIRAIQLNVLKLTIDVLTLRREQLLESATRMESTTQMNAATSHPEQERLSTINAAIQELLRKGENRLTSLEGTAD